MLICSSKRMLDEELMIKLKNGLGQLRRALRGSMNILRQNITGNSSKFGDLLRVKDKMNLLATTYFGNQEYGGLEFSITRWRPTGKNTLSEKTGQERFEAKLTHVSSLHA